MLKLFLRKIVSTRPQVSFLPLVEDKGATKPIYQPSLEKTLAIYQERAAMKQIETTPTNQTVAV